MSKNRTALVFAIQTEYSYTIDFLAPVTTTGLDEALKNLAAFHTDLTPAVEDLLRRAASEENAVGMGHFLVESSVGSLGALSGLYSVSPGAPGFPLWPVG